MPVVDDQLSPMRTLVPKQLHGHDFAAHLGLDVDQPRHLAKRVPVD
jgi:glucosamine--fructose-6-phosphate aminotransferase (isomerizing)